MSTQLKRNGHVAHLIKTYSNYWPLPNNACAVFWISLWVFVRTVLFIPAILFCFYCMCVAALYMYYGLESSGFIDRVGAALLIFLITIFFLIPTAIAMHWVENKINKSRTKPKRKKDSNLKVMWRTYKDKYCPTVEWTDER